MKGSFKSFVMLRLASLFSQTGLGHRLFSFFSLYFVWRTFSFSYCLLV